MTDFSSDKIPEITESSVKEILATKNKRICFSEERNKEPKKSNYSSLFATFNVPFSKGFENVFPFDLLKNKNIPGNPNPNAHWLPIYREEDYKEIQNWVSKQGDRVFLLDCLHTSIALSYTRKSPSDEKRTPIGQLEYDAKYHQDNQAIVTIAKYCQEIIEDETLCGNNHGSPYIKADLICAVPPRREKNFDLPTRLTSELSEKLEKIDITKFFKIENLGTESDSIKNISVSEKWRAWEMAEVNFLSDFDITKKDIVLIDDKYQSGISMQYIAMKLREAGAGKICGLCVVKTLKDTDNQ